MVPLGLSNFRELVLPCQLQQSNQLRQLLIGETGKLLPVQLLHGFVQRREQRQSGGRNANGDYPPVAALAAAGREFAFFQAVEEARNVGVAGDHAVADLGTGQPCGFSATQDAEYVILRRRDAVRFQQVDDLVEMKLGGLLDLDKDTGPGGVERRRRHALSLLVITNIVKRSIV